MNNCPFCAIAAGEIDSDVVYKDNHVIAILKVRAAVPGHIVLMPIPHFVILEQIDKQFLSYIIIKAKQIASAIIKIGSPLPMYLLPILIFFISFSFYNHFKLIF